MTIDVAQHADERQAAEHLADQDAGEADVAIRRPAEHLVEAVVERRQERLLAGRRLQQQRRERRAQRQRVDDRQQHRERDRDRELLIQQAGDAAHEADRHEHRGQDEADGDRPGPTPPPSP